MRSRRSRVRSATIDLGVTGPPSFAEDVQRLVHRVTDSTPQEGWDAQLATLPGLALRYDEMHHFQRDVGDSGLLQVQAQARAVVGNLVTAFSLAGALTMGFASDQLAWTPAEPTRVRPPRIYVRAAYWQELVLHNVFVEGHGASGRAERRPLVGHLALGTGYRWRSGAVEYQHVVRGREYHDQPGPHTFGSVTLTLHAF